MRPIIALVALLNASAASAQDRLELKDAYARARTASIVSAAAPVAGLVLTGALSAADVDDDVNILPFGLALLIGAPVHAWSANRGRRLLEQDEVRVNGLMGDLATLSSIVYAGGLGISFSEVIEGDGAIAVMFVGLVGSYGFGVAQWDANRRARLREPNWAFSASSSRQRVPPVTLTVQW